MSESIYHIALIEGTGPTRCWRNDHRADTVVVQARRDMDNLSCEAWKYYGPRIITKVQLHEQRVALLAAINTIYSTAFTHIIID